MHILFVDVAVPLKIELKHFIMSLGKWNSEHVSMNVGIIDLITDILSEGWDSNLIQLYLCRIL